MVFRVSIALVALLVLIAGIAPGPFNDVIQSGLGHIIRSTGWLYLLVVFITLSFLMYLAFGRLGSLRIGGEDANKNGIRDDVEALVTGSKRMSDEQKKASLQLFKAHQQGLLADQTKPADIQKVQEDLIKSWQCVGQKFGFSQDKPGIKQFIEMYERQMNNTPERENRYGALQCDSLKLLLIDRSAQDKLSKTPCE